MKPIMPMENQSTPLPNQIPQNAEASFDVPQASPEFRTVPNTADDFGKIPQVTERKENHTLTVREARSDKGSSPPKCRRRCRVPGEPCAVG
jgi:hypothetical protein